MATPSRRRAATAAVVADSRAWRDGKFVEILGHYDPRKSPPVVKVDVERAKHWMKQGAQASETVRGLLKRAAKAAAAAA